MGRNNGRYVKDGKLYTKNGYEMVNYSKDDYDNAYKSSGRVNKPHNSPTSGSSGGGFHLSQDERNDWGKWAKYYINEDNFTDYAPYGRNKYGTPFNKNGRPINGGSFDQTGFDPTGKSDQRRYKDTIISKDRWNYLGRGYDKYINSKGSDKSSGHSSNNRNSYTSSYVPFNPPTGGYDNSYNPYNSQLSALRRAKEKALEARQNAYNQGVNELDKTIDQGEQAAFVTRKKQEKTLPQMMAVNGYTGGMTETAANDIGNTYQNALASLKDKKAEELGRLSSNFQNELATDSGAYDVKIADTISDISRKQREEENLLYERARQEKLDAFNEKMARYERSRQEKLDALNEERGRAAIAKIATRGQESYTGGATHKDLGSMSDKELFAQIENATSLNMPDVAKIYKNELSTRYGNGTGETDLREKIENEVLGKPAGHFSFSDDIYAYGDKQAVAEKVRQMISEGKSDEEITKFILKMGLKPDDYY